MIFRTISLATLAALVVLASGAHAGEATLSDNQARFEALKGLAGDWVEADKDGKPTDKLVSRFRVTAAGTAVEETIAPGSDHEMVTMYHLDGSDLVLTHFCVLGNQPRMKAEPATDSKTIAFKLTSCGNLKSENDNHMNQATFHLVGKDRFQAEWVACKDGNACHTVKLDLVRKP
ncbi:hypothetical protein ACYOEI_29795 [Singulisphaera rosea]